MIRFHFSSFGNLLLSTNVCLGYGCSPLSGLSSVPDPEWLPELDWLPADEGRARRPLSSSLP